MAGKLHFDFVRVDEQHVVISNVVQAMIQNAAALKQVKGQLLQVFTGAGAASYDEVHTYLEGQINSYNDAAQQLGSAIAAAAGSQGHMQHADYQTSKLFDGVHHR